MNVKKRKSTILITEIDMLLLKHMRAAGPLPLFYEVRLFRITRLNQENKAILLLICVEREKKKYNCNVCKQSK